MTTENIGSSFFKLLGIEKVRVSHTERIVSAIGGFISIVSIFFVSQWFVGTAGAEILVASMGASAVLLFAVPHGQLSQPWAVLGGHVISAIIGVTCAQMISHEILAAGVAVGFAIGVMYYLKCIHPPGGATALSAVIGGDIIQNLGYQFVLTPVLINVSIILFIAFIYNYFFSWRRYPISLHQRKRQDAEQTMQSTVSHGDFVYALSQIDSFVDVSEYDLLRIYELATKQSQNRHLNANQITVGGYYSNGEYGDNWSVRQIVDESANTDNEGDLVVYKIVAGRGRRTSSYVSKVEFARWAKYQVIRDEENWKRCN